MYVCVLIISSGRGLASSFSYNKIVVGTVAFKPDSACFRLSSHLA